METFTDANETQLMVLRGIAPIRTQIWFYHYC